MGNANTEGRQETAAPAMSFAVFPKPRPRSSEQRYFNPRHAWHDPRDHWRKRCGQIDVDVDPFGYYKADAGEIFISGQKTQIPDSQAAIAAGIGMVFQHFKLVQNFTVLENVILGAEDGALLNTSLRNARATLRQLAQEYELEVDPDAVIEDLSVGHQQRVNLKALYRRPNLILTNQQAS